jgi:hypothetical protein
MILRYLLLPVLASCSLFGDTFGCSMGVNIFNKTPVPFKFTTTVWVVKSRSGQNVPADKGCTFTSDARSYGAIPMPAKTYQKAEWVTVPANADSFTGTLELKTYSYNPGDAGLIPSIMVEDAFGHQLHIAWNTSTRKVIVDPNPGPAVLTVDSEGTIVFKKGTFQ